ncbi:MAG TPA: acyl-CoA dehydrogenase family protein [Chitinophagaceae bacterium]|jgi:alkylation response protein AidB-like acyl-CoA dehydrogenase
METYTSSRTSSTDRDLVQVAGELGAIIGKNTDEEEKNRKLSKPVINALKEAGLFNLYLPKSLGGFEADPVTTAKVVEETALHNTAAGWALMVANTSAWWCNTLPEKGIEEIYKNGPDTLIAGAFHPPMRASRVDGGYQINGRSPLTSNVHEAKWIFVTALVMEEGNIKMNNGIPEVIGVFMNPQDCQIIDTWYTLGMKATDSNDVAAEDVFVPDHRLYPLIPGLKTNSYYNGILYRFAAVGISITSLIAPVSLAVARNAINELKMMAEKKTPLGSAVSIRERGTVQRKLGMAEACVQSSRAYLYHTLEECWNKTLAGKKLSLDEKAGLLLAAVHTNQSCLQAVDLMYSAAGSSAIYLKNKLAHYFTDAQVIRQHGFLNDSRYETVAQVYFGLQPDLPVITF